MSRKSFLTWMSWIGLAVVVVLVVAGGLLTWGSSYTQTQVRDQLAAQQISFPPAGPGLDPEQYPELQQYAGQQVVNGEQANAYAAYIQSHLDAIAGGQTYSQVSAASREDPENEELLAQRESLFMGTTLRGMLLQAYAFSTIGRVAWVGAVVAFAAAGILLVLVIVGFVRARQLSEAEATAPEAQRSAARDPLPAQGC
jgi:hypothetical protein